MSDYSRMTIQPVPRSAAYYYQQRRRHKQPPWELGVEPPFEKIVAADNLIRIFDVLKREGGQAPGPDGVSYRQLSRVEAAALMRDLSRLALDGKFKPNKGLKKPIPKPTSKPRILTIRDIMFRVVSAALNEALTPFWKPIFLHGSMGFRKERSPYQMLAEIEWRMVHEDRPVLAIDDVKKAFDNIPIDDLMNDHRQHVHDERLLQLIETVLRGHDAERKIGIDQGGAYSPTGLNVRLHHAHDLPFSGELTNPPWYRYADNLAYLCQSVPEGQQALNQTSRFLGYAKLTLKGEDGAPKDLRQDEVELLGFTLRMEDDRLILGRNCLAPCHVA